jgi:hypothetical protein
MKNIVPALVSIAVLMTVPFAASAADPGNPAPQMKEFHFNRAPNYPNPMASRASQPSSEDLARIFDSIGVDPADREPIVEASGKYRELMRKPGEELKAAAGKLKGSLGKDAASPEPATLLQQAVDAEQSLAQAKKKAFEEVTKEMNDQRRAQTFLYIFALDNFNSAERSAATAGPKDAPNTELPRPATGVRLRPTAPPTTAVPSPAPKSAVPSSPAQPPAAPKQ